MQRSSNSLANSHVHKVDLDWTDLSTRSLMIDQSCRTYILFFRIGAESLGENNYALPVDIVGFKEFTQDNLRFTIGIYICRIECLLVSFLSHIYMFKSRDVH